MEPEGFDVEQVKTYWLTEAQEAIEVADHLVEKGDYSYSLFFGHLAIEKLLEGALRRQASATCSSNPQPPEVGQGCRSGTQ